LVRRPSHPTLFPYTTLFRSSDPRRTLRRGTGPARILRPGLTLNPPQAQHEMDGNRRSAQAETVRSREVPGDRRSPALVFQSTVRSEEHTSELQSRENLVCRL